MLVVVAIISLLAGLIFTVGFSSIRKARRVRCLHNLRQFVMNRGFRLGLSASQATERLRQCSPGEECQSGRPPGWTEEKAQQRFGTDILAYKYTSDGYLLIGYADGSVRALRSEE